MSENEVLVINPEDRSWAERLLYALIASTRDPDVGTFLGRMKFADVQKALRSLLPPKLEEPMGLAALVKDAEGTLWIRVCRHRTCNSWRPMEEYDVNLVLLSRRHWEDINVVEILSKGDLST